MTSQLIHTLIEPSIVSIMPVRTEPYILTSSIPTSIATTLTTLITSTITAVPTASASDPPASLPTTSLTTIPPLPSAFASPISTPHSGILHTSGTPVLAVLALLAIVIFALILLSALLYFVLLRCVGKCPHCSANEAELQKWKTGELKPVVPFAVGTRVEELDVERGLGPQGALCRFPGRGGETEEAKKVSKSSPAQAHTTPRDSGGCGESIGSGGSGATTLVGDADTGTDTNSDAGFPATYSVYQRDVVAPRDAERKRLIQEADEQALSRACGILAEPGNRESVLLRAKVEVNDMVRKREEEEKKKKKEEKAGVEEKKLTKESRFKERFSLATIENPEILEV